MQFQVCEESFTPKFYNKAAAIQMTNHMLSNNSPFLDIY